jgi:hypothetical protein
MKQGIECEEASSEIHDGIFVPEPALLKRERVNRYGSIPGLPDEELADPDELGRCIFRDEWGPVLLLPKTKSSRFNPAWNWSVDIDFNAFASVDFERTQPQFDKLRYKIEKLREKLKDMVFMLKIMSARIPGRAKLKILRLVKKGLLDIGDIVDNQMYFLAEMYLRAWNLREEVERLYRKSRQQREEDFAAWLAE